MIKLALVIYCELDGTPIVDILPLGSNYLVHFVGYHTKVTIILLQYNYVLYLS